MISVDHNSLLSTYGVSLMADYRLALMVLWLNVECGHTNKFGRTIMYGMLPFGSILLSRVPDSNVAC